MKHAHIDIRQMRSQMADPIDICGHGPQTLVLAAAALGAGLAQHLVLPPFPAETPLAKAVSFCGGQLLAAIILYSSDRGDDVGA